MPRNASKTFIDRGDAADVKFDPLLILGEDLLVEIFKNLTPKKLLKVALVSKQWRALASSDRIWEPVCRKEWKNRVYIPGGEERPHTWKSKYLRAETDRKRTAIKLEEICSFEWYFRFKRTAGPVWTQELDPYWINNKDESKMMRRRFTREHLLISPKDDALEYMQPDPYHWAFASNGNNRVQVDDFPPLQVKRRSKDWGWIMENEWVLFIADLTLDGPHRFGPVSLPLSDDYIMAMQRWI